MTINNQFAPTGNTIKSISQLSFFVLCIVEFAGTRPFEGGNIQSVAMESKGNITEALIYILSTGMCIVSSALLKGRNFSYLSILPIVSVVIYCAVSMMWALSIGHALPRLLQLILVTAAVSIFIIKTSPSTTLKIITYSLATIMFLNLISVFSVKNAIHHSNTLNEKLIGAWKGLHIHKNYAGAVAAVSLITFFCRLRNGIGKYNVALVIISAAFLIGTNSKTSIALCLIAIFSLYICISLKRTAGTLGIYYFLLSGMLIFTLVVYTYSAYVSTLLEDRTLLTGRVELWNVLFIYISENYVLGSGYGSFWRTGTVSPILDLTWGWGTRTGQGHNGYIDTLATLGVPGFILVLFAFVIRPFAKLLLNTQKNNFYYDISFCFILFAATHNLTESSLLSGNNPIYFIFIIGILINEFVSKERKSKKSRAKILFL